MGASLTLQEKRWCTARLRACFFSPTRVAEHFSHPATFRSDPPKWWALRRVPPPLKGILKRSGTWRHLDDGASSVLWHMFASPLEPPAPSGVGRSLARQPPPVKPTGSRASEFWGHKCRWKWSTNPTLKLLFLVSPSTADKHEKLFQIKFLINKWDSPGELSGWRQESSLLSRSQTTWQLVVKIKKGVRTKMERRLI